MSGDGASTSTAPVPASTPAVDGAGADTFLHPSVLGRPPSAMINGEGAGGGKLTVKLGGAVVRGLDGAVRKPDAAVKLEGKEVKEDVKGKGKARAMVDWTPAQVEQLDVHELGRHWGPHLVSLGAVIERCIAQGADEARTRTPALTDFDRKKRLVDYVIHSRRQIIKLLVLVKWSASSAMAHKVISIVEFFARQNKQFSDTVDMLHQSKNSFYTARLRNYDIPYALQVLTHGRPRLPGMLTDVFGQRSDVTPQEALDALDHLESEMRLRLAMREVLPDEMRRYTIGDGKARFRVEGLFEATLTLGGAANDEKAVWYLLGIEFLFSVWGPRGIRYNPTPTGAMKEQIVALGNEELAGPPPTEQQPDPRPPERPLVRIFTFLRSLALNYQLEALFGQAAQLDRTAWARNILATIAHDRKSLRIEYWTRARPPPPPPRGAARKGAPAPPPPPQGSITISIATSIPGPTASHILSVLGHPTSPPPQSLHVSWDPVADVGSPSSARALQLELAALDLDKLLTAVCRLHADALIRKSLGQLEDARAAGGTMPAFEQVRLLFDDEGPEGAAKGLRTQLRGSQAVEVGIETVSGRYTLRILGAGDAGSAAAKVMLKRAADLLNEHPDALGEMLIRVRSMILLDEIESQAARIGLHCTRRLPLDPADAAANLGVSSNRAGTFISLPDGGAHVHYLGIILAEDGVKCSLVALREPPGRGPLQQVAVNVQVSVPIQARRLGRDEKLDPFSLTRDQLQDLFHACSARLAFNTMARQLVARRIPVRFVTPPFAAGDVPAPLPWLCMPTPAILRTKRAAEGLYPIMRVRVGLPKGPGAGRPPRVIFDLRIRDPARFGRLPGDDADDDDDSKGDGKEAEGEPLSEGAFDRKTGIVRWTAEAFSGASVETMLDWLEEVHDRLAPPPPPDIT